MGRDRLQPGDRIVVRTPDCREFRGRILAFVSEEGKQQQARIRLDTGWEVSYPVSLLAPLDQPDSA